MPRIDQSGVYWVLNLITFEFYIGSSVNTPRRWREHRWNYCKPMPLSRQSILYAAMRKYGPEHFTFRILELCEPTKEALMEREQYYLDTLKPAYNINPRAYTRLGAKHSKATLELFKVVNKANALKNRKGKTFAEIFGDRVHEVLARQSAGRKGKRLGCSPWNKGVPLTEEHKFKFAYAPWTPERRRKQSLSHLGKTAWNKGKPWSAAVRLKLSIAHLGQKGWNTGLKMSKAFCRKQSQIAKARYDADPTHQQRMTEAARQVNTGKQRTEEAKRNIGEGNLRSEKRKGYAESRRGVARPKELGEKVSASLQTSEKAKAYHEGRVGKSRGNNPSGHYGVIWDKARGKYQVRIKGKSYGRYQQLEDAIAKAKEIMAELGMGEQGSV